jgi:putative sigma-54 modulation protein
LEVQRLEITFTGRNVEVTRPLRQYAAKRLSKLDKYFGERPVDAEVRMSVERKRHVVEVTIPLGGMLLRGEVASADMYASIDLVVDKLERQIHKFKTRLNRKLRKDSTLLAAAGAAASLAASPEGAEGAPEAPAAEPSGEEGIRGGEEFPVVRRKRFAVKPLPVDEAILQMNLLGHDFFVFRNAESEEINVVYRRQDGSYGLIEPEP